ncbi:MAG TPA: MDR family MFS transporter, partial [Spirochaetota bacterium]|nr:MDR family MFS transporter [Spirochaetota bacterium]HOR45321.1 MDR family MFS transporter [Spirochaetota bacterium]HPK57057.1 MDR family MFS transporter [Spirochaetota bacterium]
MKTERISLQSRERFLIMAGAMLTLLLAALDNTIVSTAMPKIIKDLNGIEHYSWPFTSYLLFSTVILPISGKLADIYGRKRITISGIIFFIVASALCGLSSNMIMLSVFRGLQGIGGGICVSSAFVIVAEIFPPRERGKYMGILASMFAVASILGPGAGGFIADKLSWHWIFYINIPLGILAFFLIHCNLHPLRHHEEKRRIDYPGVGAFILFVAPFLFAVTEAGKRPVYSFDILALFALSIIAFAVFISIENKSKEPLLSLHFFREKVFASSVISSSLGNMAIFGAAIFLPLYLQSAKGKSATESGMIMMPMMVLMILSSNISGRILTHRYLFKFLASIGLFIAFVGMLCIGLFGAKAGINYIILFSGFAGFGIGLTFPVYNAAPQSLFSLKQVGLVTSLLQFFRNMGGAVGSAF